MGRSPLPACDGQADGGRYTIWKARLDTSPKEIPHRGKTENSEWPAAAEPVADELPAKSAEIH
jgi:hypothetical protein